MGAARPGALAGLIRLLMIALAAAAAGPALAQDVNVRAGLSESRAIVGDRVAYQIVVESSQDVDPPQIPPVPGLSIEFAGTSHQPAPVYIVNGRRQDTGPDKYILSYSVTPLRAGEFTIPELEVRVAGRDFTLAPVRLVATEPPEDAGAILEVSTSAARAYVGEPITLTLTWYFASDVRGVSFSTLADAPPGYELLPAADPRPAGARPNDSRYQTLTLDGQEVICTLSRTIRGGREYGVVSLTRTLIPTRPGPLEIGPFAALAQVKVAERNIGILLTEDVVERRVSRSEPVTIDVVPLPAEGRPANFTGLVGRFSIEAAASPTDVSVGDPIELEITIRGPEPLQRLEPPDLEGIAGFAQAFRLSPDGARPSSQQEAGSRRFTTTIRAMSDRVDEVPPVELLYFDTHDAEYRIARSEPIPLRVRPTREVTARDAISAAEPEGPRRTRGEAGSRPLPPAGTPAPLVPAAPGLLASTTSTAALRDESTSLRTLLTAPAWAAGVVLPPMTFAAACAYALARRASPTPQRRHRHAISRARRMLRADARDHAAISQALRAYISTRFEVPEHAVTAFDARRLLDAAAASATSRRARPAGTSKATTDLAAAFADMLDRADAARLGGVDGPSPRDARELLARLEREARP